MSPEELVRAALAEEAKAEPGEDGAYERFLRRRRRGALAVAGSTGLAVALVLAVAIGGGLVVGGGRGVGGAAGPVAPATTAQATTTTALAAGPVETTLPAPPPVPVSAAGVVRRERQGFELTLPKGWKVDQSTTRSYHQFGQPWLVISPGGRQVSATRTAGSPSSRPWPRRTSTRASPSRTAGAMGGQSFSSLSGARSSGRRPDGRAFAVGDQGGMVSYHIAWPYRCEPADPAPRRDRGGSCNWTSREPAGRRG